MKIKFKHQAFQAEAAKVVCDVFEGQPHREASYMIDPGRVKRGELDYKDQLMGFRNNPISLSLSDEVILSQIQKIQRAHYIKPSSKLEGRYNLTIEMETGVGKTYTYIKTIFELNKRYGWSKFIIVVPSVAIREGVYKSFKMTEEHFAEDYGKKVSYFIYNSKNLTDIESFASDNKIRVMIINTQAFNARGEDARRIYRKLDDFKSRRLIDVLAATNPIMIIDEPQRVEGKDKKNKTREALKKFNALMTLRYSATHYQDSTYNMVYRLDAMEAYNRKLVKKIAVKGITVSGSNATEGYLYLESFNISQDSAPTVNMGFDVKGVSGVRQVVRKLSKGDNLYAKSNGLEEYEQGYLITDINALTETVQFENGITLGLKDVVGSMEDERIRRIQIRSTILTHMEKERALFHLGIKVLSLFFIDEVEKYRVYGTERGNGIYADMFEQEYEDAVKHYAQDLFEGEEYYQYLKSTIASKAHDGYFSKDKKGKFINSKVDRGTTESSDASAYDLIMKDKERLLDRREPLRFIFSHSALREGWDNPNVFQICTLKRSASDINKRQEVGRGLRLCVNSSGERMDSSILGDDVHRINKLTIIANESYDSFAKNLQTEYAQAIGDRPAKVTTSLFTNIVLKDKQGGEVTVNTELAHSLYDSLLEGGYIKKGELTDKYYEDKDTGAFELNEEVATYAPALIGVLDSIYNPAILKPENEDKQNVELKFEQSKFEKAEFKKLWALIAPKSYYTVNFDEEELVSNAVAALNARLRIRKIDLIITAGEMDEIRSKEQLQRGQSFKLLDKESETVRVQANKSVKFDIIGKLTEGTGLTRKSVVEILTRIEPSVFAQFSNNPEEFLMRAAELINEQKASIIIQRITYDKLEDSYDSSIFTEPKLKGQMGVNVMNAERHLYDHVLYDSQSEKEFAKELEAHKKDIAVYVKLPKTFFISTPVGKYSPDWAIAFEEGSVKHIYFVAETKGNSNTLQFHESTLRGVEEAKIRCAERHFEAISNNQVRYSVIRNYEDLLNIVK